MGCSTSLGATTGHPQITVILFYGPCSCAFSSSMQTCTKLSSTALSSAMENLMEEAATPWCLRLVGIGGPGLLKVPYLPASPNFFPFPKSSFLNTASHLVQAIKLHRLIKHGLGLWFWHYLVLNVNILAIRGHRPQFNHLSGKQNTEKGASLKDLPRAWISTTQEITKGSNCSN